MLYRESSRWWATGEGGPESASGRRVCVPYSIGVYIQAAVYALAEQATVIISEETNNNNNNNSNGWCLM